MARSSIDPRIKLRHLNGFLEVVRLKSVVRAAEALHISQPAMSKTIQELEELLGKPLFDRSRRKLFLTPFGEVFYRYASTSLAALRQGIDAASDAAGATMLKIGALPTVSARVLPSAVSAFTAEGENVRTSIITGPNNYLLSLLRTGDVDLVIGRMTEPDAMLGLSFEHLYSERVVMVVRTGHPLLAESQFNLRMIEAYQTLMPTSDSVIRRSVDGMLFANGVTNLRDEVETVSNAFGRSYVRQTDAVWIISEGVVAQDVLDGQLALLPFAASETTGPVGLTSRIDTTPSLACSRFMQTVRDVVANMA